MKYMNRLFGRQFRQPDPDPNSPSDPPPSDPPPSDPPPSDPPPSDPPSDPSPSEKALLAEVMAKKGQIKTLSEQVAALTESAKAWEGVDISAVTKMLKANADAEEAALIAAGEFDQVKDQMNAAHKGVVDGLNTQIVELQETISGKDGMIGDLTIGNSFSASTFVLDKLTLSPTKARQLYGAHFERDDAGNVVGYNKPSGTDGRAPLVDGEGANLAFDEAFKRIVDADVDKDSLYKSRVKPGARSITQPGGDPTDPPSESGVGVDRITAGLADGQLKKGKELKI